MKCEYDNPHSKPYPCPEPAAYAVTYEACPNCQRVDVLCFCSEHTSVLRYWAAQGKVFCDCDEDADYATRITAVALSNR